jgi:hypothetical protein
VPLKDRSALIEQAVRRYGRREGVMDVYRASSELAEGSPILKAADSLFQAAKKGGNVIISSGFTILSAGKCETDGPLGSVVLGRLLNEMGCHLAFLSDVEYLGIFRELGKETDLKSYECLSFPVEHDLAKLETSRIFEELSPVAIIAVERPGWNWKHIHHNMRGEDISPRTGKVDYVFDDAHIKKTLTIGIGDGGNEIGMGNVEETVKRRVPFGSMCQCPCKGGIASSTRVDHLIVSFVSNWGAYGLTAQLAYLAKLPFKHTADDERRLIKAAVKAGAVDGISGKPIESVDGMDAARNAEVVKRIREATND